MWHQSFLRGMLCRVFSRTQSRLRLRYLGRLGVGCDCKPGRRVGEQPHLAQKHRNRNSRPSLKDRREARIVGEAESHILIFCLCCVAVSLRSMTRPSAQMPQEVEVSRTAMKSLYLQSLGKVSSKPRSPPTSERRPFRCEQLPLWGLESRRLATRPFDEATLRPRWLAREASL